MNSPPTASPPAGPAALGASFRRSSTDRVVLGLCGGLAQATGTSSLAVRVATIFLSVVLLPLVLLAYVVTALILPRDDGSTLLGNSTRDRRDVVVGLILTLLTAPIVLGAAASHGLTSGDAAWPLLFVGAGAVAVLAFNARRESKRTAAAGTTAQAASPATAGTAAQAASPTTAGTAEQAATAAYAAYAAPVVQAAATTDADAGAGTQPGVEGSADTAIQPAVEAAGAPQFVQPGALGNEPQPPQEPQPKRRSIALPVLAVMALIPALAAVFIAIGVIDASWETLSITLAILALAAAGGAVAIALLRPSYLGAGLLVVLAAFIGALSIGVHQVGPYADDGIGERIYRPASVSDLQPEYTLGIGQLDVDLRELNLRPGSRTTVNARVGFGEIRIAVPAGVRVVTAPGSEVSNLTFTARQNGAKLSESAAAPTILVNAGARAGNVQLLSGNSTNLDNLEIVAEEPSGFWDGDQGRGPGSRNTP